MDGSKRKYECVSKAFIGFPLEKGKHVIEFVYKAPLLTAGKLMSLAGVLIFAGLTGWELISKRRKEKPADS